MTPTEWAQPGQQYQLAEAAAGALRR
jgi:hypothetical protein